MGACVAVWQMRPAVENRAVDREPFVLFPTHLGDWTSSPPTTLTADIENVLGADDYHSVQFSNPAAAADVSLFIAWYEDQSDGGTHSPEVCLPGAGWEIAWIERVDLGPAVGYDKTFNINRAVIQKGEVRMMAYYWFEQHGRHVAWDLAAKMYLLWDGLTIGRTDGALVRLITPINRGETEAEAEERLKAMFVETNTVLPRFVPGLEQTE